MYIHVYIYMCIYMYAYIYIWVAFGLWVQEVSVGVKRLVSD